MMRVNVDARPAVRKLSGADRKVSAAADAALKEGGFLIEREAKRRAPVDTGRLRASIRTEDAGFLRVMVMDGVSYGVFQEYGTSRVPAQPFLRPAVNSQREVIRKLISKAVGVAI